MSNNRRSFVAAAAALIASAATAPIAQAQTPDAVLNKANAAWTRVHSLSGIFEQTLTNPLMRSTSVSHGEFRQQRPNKLAIRFTDPAGDAIVADGTFLWVYLQQATPNQVIKRPVTDRLDVPIDVSQFLDGTATRYDVTSKGAEPVDGRPAKVLGLAPRTGTRAPFTKATVWVDDADGLIRQFEVVEASGTTRRIKLTTLTVNPPVKSSDFAFKMPKGAKVITP